MTIDDRTIERRRHQLELRGWKFGKPEKSGGTYRITASIDRTRAEFARPDMLHALADAVTWAGVEQDIREEEARPCAAE